MGREEGLTEGRIKGISEGVKLTQLENAKKMLDDNLAIELIEKYTGLSQEEIENLK